MILVTGGAGYIGSHTCIALAQAGHDVLIVDNFTNSTTAALGRLSRIIGRPVHWREGDVRDGVLLDGIFAEHPISAVMHFAGRKSVAESVERPLEYFDSNVVGSIAVVQAMQRAGCKTLVFSSSATIYGSSESMPVSEDAAYAVASPYGRTKLVVEEMLQDLIRSDASWSIATLRYFNPAGAHPSGLIGENPLGTPNNLMPYITQVASGARPKLRVFGNDYPTLDGTGVRDFVHIMDLASGHVAALNFLIQRHDSITLNLGTGRGTSVLEMIQAFERASGRAIPYEIVGRRDGDVGISFADVRRARELLGWEATRDIVEICRDVWRWQLRMSEVG